MEKAASIPATVMSGTWLRWPVLSLFTPRPYASCTLPDLVAQVNMENKEWCLRGRSHREIPTESRALVVCVRWTRRDVFQVLSNAAVVYCVETEVKQRVIYYIHLHVNLMQTWCCFCETKTNVATSQKLQPTIVYV